MVWDSSHDSVGHQEGHLGGRVGDRLGDGLRGHTGGYRDDELRGRLLGRIQIRLVGRPWANHLNRLRIGLPGRRKGRRHGCLAGRPCGRIRFRLVGRHQHHPDDDLLNDLQDNPWNELRNRCTSPGPRFGSRAEACTVLRDVGRSVAQASPMPIACPPDCSL